MHNASIAGPHLVQDGPLAKISAVDEGLKAHTFPGGLEHHFPYTSNYVYLARWQFLEFSL